MTGIAPSVAKVRTMAAPIPLAPPVTRTILSLIRRSTFLTLPVQIHESAIQRIIDSCDERCRIRTEEQSQRGHFFRLAHSSHRLRRGKLVVHLLLSPWIIL